MRVCIAGSRVTTPEMREDIWEYVKHLPEDAEVVHGGALGADSEADDAADFYLVPVHVERPEYKRYPPKVAPLWRNAKMAGMVVHVVVFWLNRSRGTENMIAQAYAAGVPCEIYCYDA